MTSRSWTIFVALAAALPLSLLVRAQSGADPDFRAEAYEGADTGASINAADAACTAAGGRCSISVNKPGTLSSPIYLAAGHSLLFRAPVEIIAPVVPAGSQTVACAPGVALHFSRPTGTVKPANGASDITVADCTVTGVGQNFVELPGRNARVRVTHITSSGFGNTLFACPSVARQSGGWDLTQLCHQIDFIGNTVLSATGTGTQYGSVSGGEISGNTISHSPEGIYLNGGEADPTHTLFAFKSDGLAGIRVLRNQVSDIVNGCIWATVSSGHLFSGNRLTHCGDVALDFEGVRNSRSTGNTVVDAGHRGGALATFFGSSGIEFADDTVTVTAAASTFSGPVIWVHNSTNDPAFTGPVTFTHITAVSEGKGAPAMATFESLHGLGMVGSHFTNVQFSMPFRFNGLRFEGNDFRYSVPIRGEAALAIGVSLYGGTDLLSNNRFIATAPEPPGSAAVSMSYSDFNASEAFELQNNDFTQASAFPIDIAITHQGQNPGVGSRWTVRANRLNHPPLVHSNGVGQFSLQSDAGSVTH